MNKITLSPPWQTYVSEMVTLFQDDPSVTVGYDDEEKVISIYVDKASKAEALEKILKHEVTFGNVKLTVNVIPPNEDVHDILDDFKTAFMDNPVVQAIYQTENPLGTHRFVGFEKKVVQFYNDQLDDPDGNKSMLFQDIAKDVFVDDLAVNYFTVTGRPY